MYRDRRLYSPGPDLKAQPANTALPMKICLIAAAAVMGLLALFFWFTGSAVLYIHYWVYVAVIALIVVLLAAAAALAIFGKIKAERPRRMVGLLLLMLMIFLIVTAASVCMAFASFQKPLGFFDSPEGENRIVVMGSQTTEGSLIEAYPAVGNHFYIAALPSEQVMSNGVIQGVEWEGERLAKVILQDTDGNETSVTVDFALLYAGEETAE